MKQAARPSWGGSANPAVVQVAVAAVSGLIFGVAIEKGRVFEPQVIVAQMKFQSFAMMKMFLSAVGTSQLLLSLLSFLPAYQPILEEIRAYNKGPLAGRGLLATVVGGGLLGMGMTLAGACPGTVLVQLGSGVLSAPAVLVGGLAGALLYMLCEPLLRNTLLPVGDPGPDKKLLTDVAHTPYHKVALPLGCMMWAVVVILELFFPWQTQTTADLSAVGVATFPSLSAPAWPPYLAGAVVGSLQIPLSVGLGKTLGSATSYSVCVHNVCYLAAPSACEKSPYIMGSKSGLRVWWQVLYVSCAVAGGFLSASASGMLGTGEPLPLPVSFLGGLLLLFGSRLAGGCTSGHGISGMSMGSLWAFAAVGAMFAGGMGLALFV